MLLCQTVEKFITDYEVYEKQLADCDLTESVIQRHQKLFGTRPEVLAADKGFSPAEAKFQELAEQVDTLAIPRRMRDGSDPKPCPGFLLPTLARGPILSC